MQLLYKDPNKFNCAVINQILPAFPSNQRNILIQWDQKICVIYMTSSKYDYTLMSAKSLYLRKNFPGKLLDNKNS